MIRNTKLFIRLLIPLLLTVLILQLLVLWRHTVTNSEKDYWTVAYNMVNTFAPLITIVLLMITFFYQNQQLKEQRIQTQLARDTATEANRQIMLQQIEERFFTFLKIHRENGDNMMYGKEKGKRVFIAVFKKFEHIYNELELILEELKEAKALIKALETKQKIEAAYLITFYGCRGEHSTRMLNGALQHFNSLMQDSKQTFSEIIIKELIGRKVVADGFQASLGHYFRHMFQTVIYIHNHPLLTPKDKKFYLKRLRAQLSNHEIAILFVNSFSLGRRWKSYNSQQQPQKTDLITTYRFIQNLPSDFFSKFDFRCYFPKIIYEESDIPFMQSKDYKKFLCD